MPKIVIKVEHKAKTRSTTVGGSEKEKGVRVKQTPNDMRASSTPRRSERVKVETISKHAKPHEPKFFTVEEDRRILDVWQEQEGDLPLSQISSRLSKSLKHSEESIRDRIRKILSKLRQVDTELISQESKVSHFQFFVSL